MLDTAAYLYELQTRYYQRFAAAIRATGYQGMVTGSNWQTSGGIPHLYNLLTDRSVGRIDRHNYVGGHGADSMKPGVTENDSSMLWQPGGALLSTGFQQFSDRPFGLTEWMEQAPNEWAAEAPPLIAFYGFGLQGWDVAYEGNNTQAAFDRTYGTWLHVQGPLDLGLYPAVARAIYRGDISEGALIASQHISLDALRSGQQVTADAVAQYGDNKVITSSIPSEALAAGRVAMTVQDMATASLMPDLGTAIADHCIVSSTTQLTWHYASHDTSYVTVNTPGTKGVIGFAAHAPIVLGDVTMTIKTPFAVVLMTALDRDKTLATSASALITALARERNTGMTLDAEHRITAVGTAPILLEPVQASLTLGRPIRTVFLLDHDGRRTARTAVYAGQTITIDGVHDQTMYYEVVFR
jgi:hypothetical protein